MYWVVRIDMYHSYCYWLTSNFTLGMMMEEMRVKPERPESRPDVKPDMGRTVRGDNRNRNQRFRKTMEYFFGKTTEKFFGRTEAICGHIFESTLLRQADQYQKTLKEIAKYSSMNFNSNMRKSIEK